MSDGIVRGETAEDGVRLVGRVNVRLSEEEERELRRMAERIRVATGRRCTVSDVVRQGVTRLLRDASRKR